MTLPVLRIPCYMEAAAWVDERKTKTEEAVMSWTDYQERLRHRFESTTAQMAHMVWAKVAFKEQSSSTLSAPLLNKTKRLSPHVLIVVRCRGANQSGISLNLLLTAGLDKTFLSACGGSREEHVTIHGIHCEYLIEPFRRLCL